MKRNVIAVFATVVLAGTFVGAQYSPAPAPQAPAPQAADQAKPGADDATATGCLVQGSGPTTFILENAKLSTDAKDAHPNNF